MESLARTRALEDFTNLASLSEVNSGADPQAAYAQLRKQWGDVAPVELEPGVPAWLVMGYHEILQVSRNARRQFTRNSDHWRYAEVLKNPHSTLAAIMSPLEHAYYADGEKHRRLRAPLDEGLAALDEHKMGRATQAICREVIAKFADRGEADLIAQYAVLVPMLSVASWFGLGIEEGGKLTQAVIWAYSHGENSQKGLEILTDVLTNLMVSRRKEPTDDLATAFVNHHGLQTDEEISNTIMLVFMAGYQASIAWIAQTLRVILTDPRFGNRLRGGRLGLEDALDEVLWRRSPAANLPAGYALTDTEVGGKAIRKGDALILSYAAANVDPRVHGDDPWLETGNRAHLSYGVGPHVCPAQRPGRLIARIAVETVLTQLHSLKLAIPAEEITTIPSMWAVCPASLPVRFTRAV